MLLVAMTDWSRYKQASKAKAPFDDVSRLVNVEGFPNTVSD